MLEIFTIFTKGGIVVFTFHGPFYSPQGQPINDLIQQVLIEERGGTNKQFEAANTSLALQYKLDNPSKLIFAAAYQKILADKITYVPQFLENVQKYFVAKFGETIKANPFAKVDFTDAFNRILRETERADQEESKKSATMRRFEDTKKYERSAAANRDEPAPSKTTAKTTAASPAKEESESEASEPEGGEGGADGDEFEKNRAAFIAKRKAKSPTKAKSPASKPPSASKKSIAKESGPKSLDYSTKEDREAVFENDVNRMRETTKSMMGEIEEINYEEVNEKDEAKASSGMFSFFKGLASGAQITPEMLAPVLDKTRLHLIGKNVAAEVAQKLVDSIGDSLLGQSKGSFTQLNTVVKQSLGQALTRILSPKRTVNILRDVQEARAQGRPYSVVFCGVNGVGKSTNLAKVCYWLMENNMRVMIAACDTFRAGAVEQLRTHVRKLEALLNPGNPEKPKVKLYDRGYGKDDAAVAADALRLAKEEGFDVVLVDTAGRMQDNEKLMRSLTKLIATNKPDLVLFVGEALVGSEAVDQLAKFNQALVDFSNEPNPRVIDGIVLTKFDTIDDKVGASISMTYTTGQPIVFVGTGQSYHDLKKLNVQAVVNSLLKA